MATNLRFSGVLQALKKRSMELDDKLRLLRYVWQSPGVVFPNKEQVLINLVTGLLVNRKKHQLSEEDTGKVWQWLRDVLQDKSAACNSPLSTKLGHTLTIKHSFTQLLLEALSGFCTRGASCPDVLRSVVGCYQAVLTSPSLAHVLAARLDYMISLLGVLCRLLTLHKCEDGMSAALAILLLQVAERYMKSQKTAHNQRQLLQMACDKLLPDLVVAWSGYRGFTAGSQAVVASTLVQVIEHTLFHKDHHDSYCAYLGHIDDGDESGQSKKARSVGHVYSTLAKLLAQPAAMTETCEYLPVLYDGFLKNNCHAGNATVAHHMLVKLLNMMGVVVPSGAQNTPPTGDDTRVTLTLCGPVPVPVVTTAVKELLCLSQKYATYSVASGTGSEGKQLHFYRGIVNILLENRSLTCDWYQCFTVLLTMNHQFLEGHLPDILTATWTGTPELPCAVHASLDDFLQELFTTYEKLRQVPKLVGHCLSSLSQVRRPGTLLLPPGMLHRYAEIVQSLPQVTTTAIWQMFADQLKERYLAPGHAADSGHYRGVCSLFYHFLLSVKVVDYTITANTVTLVQNIMAAMTTDILAPALTACTTDSSMLCATLQLCHGWGQVVLMMGNYMQHGAASYSGQGRTCQPGDLTALHSYLDTRRWKALHDKVLSTRDVTLSYVWDQLRVQQLRAAVSLSAGTDAEGVEAVIDQFTQLPDLRTCTPDTGWNGLVESVTSENSALARWHLIASNLATLDSVLSTSQVHDVARLLLGTCRLHTPETGKEITFPKVANDVLSSDWFRESPKMHTEVVSYVWGSVRDALQGDTPSPKKRKRSAHQSLPVEIMDHLSNRPEELAQVTGREEEDPKSVVSLLGDLLQMTDQPFARPRYQELEANVQLLHWLPLEHMTPGDQLRCIVGLLTFLATLNLNRQAHCDRLTSRCVDYLLVLLEAAGTVFQLIDTHIYLRWLQTLPDDRACSSAVYQKVLLLMETSCSAIVRNFSLLDKLPPVVDKLSSTMAECVGEGSILQTLFIFRACVKLMRRPYLNEHLRNVCVSLLSSMSATIIQCLPLVQRDSGTQHVVQLVRCSSLLLEASTMAGAKTSNVEKLVAVFPVIFKWCFSVLSNEMVAASAYHHMAALTFLHACCKHYTVLGDVFTSQLKHKLWTALYSWLQQFLSVQQASEMTRYNEDGDTKGNPHTLLDISVKGDTSKSVGNVLSALQGQQNNVDDARSNSILIEEDKKGLSKISEPIDSSAMSFGSIDALYKALVFRGEFEDKTSKLTLYQVQAVMAALVLSYDVHQFTQLVDRLVADVCPGNMPENVGKVQSAVYVWRQLLRLSFSPEQKSSMITASQNMMLSSLSVLQQLREHSDSRIITDITIPIVATQVQMLAFGPSLLSPQAAIMGLYSCQRVPLDRGVGLYVPACHRLCDVLDTLLTHHTDTVLQDIPAFISAAKRLLLSVVDQSSQDKIAADSDASQHLIGCAYRMERLFSLVSSHKLPFGKVAIYVVSDYVTRVQQATLLPAVKQALVPAVYKMLDLCDTHAVAQLHAVLAPGVRPVFQQLHADYTRHHKYTGKV